MPELGGDPLGGGLVVAGEHDDLDAERRAARRRRRRRCRGRVGERDHARRRGRRRRPARRCGRWRPARRGGGQQGAEVDALVVHQPAVADQRPGGRRPSATAPWPGTFRNAVGGQRGTPAVVGVAHDRRGQRMLGLALHRGGEREQLVLVDAVGDHVGDLGLALGQGAGLVHHHGVDAGGGLQRGGVLEQHAALGAEPGADHDRGRRGQAERVRAGDHHDGDGEQQRRLDAGARRPTTPAKVAVPPTSATSTSQNAARSASRCPGALEFCASCTSATIWASAVSEPTLVARTRRVPVVLIVAPMTSRARRLVHRQALAGDHRLVDLGLAVLDDAVDGDLGAGPDQQQVPDRRPRRWAPRPVRRRAAPRPSAGPGRAGCGSRRWRRRGHASRTSGPSSTNAASTVAAS